MVKKRRQKKKGRKQAYRRVEERGRWKEEMKWWMGDDMKTELEGKQGQKEGVKKRGRQRRKKRKGGKGKKRTKEDGKRRRKQT